MRIWSLHPEYLDPKGLVALWREALLAQNVLLGNTRGYKNHPQLNRFKETGNPVGAIACYLKYIADEADKRGYNFNRSKISSKRFRRNIPVTTGQIKYEFHHLSKKLRIRAPELYKELKSVKKIRLHPLFISRKGPVENWEILQAINK